MVEATCNYLTEIGAQTCCIEGMHYNESGLGVKISPRETQLAKFIRIEDTLISKQEKKCDCLVLFKQNENTKFAFFVELKSGSTNVSYQNALDQINKTKTNPQIQQILALADISEKNYKAVIITGEKIRINRPSLDLAEAQINMQIQVVPLKRDKSFELRDSIHLNLIDN